MGTRAMISLNGDPLITTHWDGYPESLGHQLVMLKSRTISDIIKVAKEHTIDFARQDIVENLNAERVAQLSAKHGLSEDQIKNGVRRGSVLSASDWEIGSIDGYDDYAEYQYDITTKDNSVWMREVHGSWKKATFGEWAKIMTVKPKKKK
jgi:hypothetical protein